MTLADAGYASGANFKALEERDAAACVSLAGRHGNVPERDPRRILRRTAWPSAWPRPRTRSTTAGANFIVEPVFGWIKAALGFRTFGLRGLAKVTGEWHLVCMALNLRRMHRLGWQRG